ncbi:MAG TPA: THUMP domain-containing protein [Candidatus Thermoplasmatota archaeon]|nr:THUMP domain-containing protein [Candidatus Thermoplasmatota archaeon]
MEYDVIILRYGELSLKSTYVRKYFETILVRNIKNAFTRENISVVVRTERGRIYLRTTDLAKSIKILPRIFGIVSFSPAMQTTSSLQDMSAMAQHLTKNVLCKQKSFAIRATRVGTHPFTSQQVAIKIGNDIVQATAARVHLNNPDIELFIEIRDKKSFLFTEKIKGAGGLPLGTQGTVLTLVKNPSSLLAAWYLMRRGCHIIFVTTNQSNEKAICSFLSHWYADAETFFIEQKSNDFYQQLSNIVSEKKCDAVITDHTFETPTKALSDLALLKKNSVVPILSPLLTMTQADIEIQCKDRGILL